MAGSVGVSVAGSVAEVAAGVSSGTTGAAAGGGPGTGGGDGAEAGTGVDSVSTWPRNPCIFLAWTTIDLLLKFLLHELQVTR